jgi:hypothetical protein
MLLFLLNNMEGIGSLRDIKEKADAKDNEEELIDFLVLMLGPYWHILRSFILEQFLVLLMI